MASSELRAVSGHPSLDARLFCGTMLVMKVEKKRTVTRITWQDASYSFEDILPDSLPLPQVIFGVLISKSPEATFIATNVRFDATADGISVVDGMVIPNKTIISLKNIDFYE